MINQQSYQQATDYILSGMNYEGFSLFTEIYDDADENERIDIISILTEVFYVPNIDIFRNNYNKNCSALRKHPYWFGPQLLDFDDLRTLVFPVNEKVYFFFDKEKNSFFEIEVNSEMETKYFFKDLSKPLFVENEANEYNLNFLTDNVRPSEDVAMDNHIYLYYENPELFFFTMQATDFFYTEALKKNALDKFVYLIGAENKPLYPIDFKARFNIDYSRKPKKDISVHDIKRLIFSWTTQGFSGVSFLNQILDHHPNLITHVYLPFEEYIRVYNFIKDKPIHMLLSDKYFFSLPESRSNEGIFRFMISGLVCYGKKFDDPKKRVNRIKRYLVLLRQAMREFNEPTVDNWLRAILFAYAQFHNRTFNDRIFPAFCFGSHDLIEQNDYYTEFHTSLFKKFKYGYALILLRDPISQAGSIFGASTNGIFFRPSARNIDLFIFGNEKLFRHKDDIIYKKGRGIRFEDLKLNHAATITTLIEFLNIPFSETLGKTTENGIVCGNEVNYWKTTGDGFDTKPVYGHIKSEDLMRPYDKYRIEMLVSAYYRYFGYEPKFYDGKKYTWEEVLTMMRESMLCDELDVGKGLCDISKIEERRQRNAYIWLRRFQYPVPVGKDLVPIRVLQPQKDLIQTELYK